MNYAIIRNIIGKIMILIAMLMILPFSLCIIYQEDLNNYLAFLIPICLLVIIGFLFNIKKAENKKMLANPCKVAIIGFILNGNHYKNTGEEDVCESETSFKAYADPDHRTDVWRNYPGGCTAADATCCFP